MLFGSKWSVFPRGVTFLLFWDSKAASKTLSGWVVGLDPAKISHLQQSFQRLFEFLNSSGSQLLHWQLMGFLLDIYLLPSEANNSSQASKLYAKGDFLLLPRTPRWSWSYADLTGALKYGQKEYWGCYYPISIFKNKKFIQQGIGVGSNVS